MERRKKEDELNGAVDSDASFLSQLARYGRLVFSPVGNSMYPILRGSRDVVVLTQAKGPLKRLDVALYRNELNQYVLHRAVGFTAHEIIFCGDGRLKDDPPVSPDRVLAVMTGFYRNERLISARSPAYRLYARLWCLNRRLRHLLLSVCYRIRALKARFRKE